MKKFFGFGSNTPPPAATSDSIVGQWKEPNGNDVTEFHADGTVIERPTSGEAIRGRYSLEGTKLTVRLEGLAEELSFAAAIKNNTLEMKDPDGQVTRYCRV
jgi:uncharacterized protein (DUF2147 family)